MKKGFIRIIVFGLLAAMAFTLYGCKKADQQSADNAAEHQDAINEVDGFVKSVDAVKASYDKNSMVSSEVESALSHAMVMEGFLDENPSLYQDNEYKTKIKQIYDSINGIDINNSALQKEEGIDVRFNTLKQIVTRIYNKLK